MPRQQDTVHESEALINRAINEALAAYKADESLQDRYDSLGDFLLHWPEYGDATLEGIRVVLRVYWQEFARLSLPREQLQKILLAWKRSTEPSIRA